VQPALRVVKPATVSPEPLVRLDQRVRGLLGSGSGPSITFLYEDEQMREWAKEVHERMESLAGSEGVRASWWRISELSAPGILAGAVSTAVRADIIVVASRPAGMPLPFYVWVNLWWPHRPELGGTLVALIGNPKEAKPRLGRVGNYLRMVAQQSRMDFLSLERPVAGHSQPKSIASSERNHWNGSSRVNGVHRNGNGNHQAESVRIR